MGSTNTSTSTSNRNPRSQNLLFLGVLQCHGANKIVEKLNEVGDAWDIWSNCDQRTMWYLIVLHLVWWCSTTLVVRFGIVCFSGIVCYRSRVHL